MAETSDNSTHNKAGSICPIELQIETGNSIVDTTCNEPTEGGHAGLCKKHYTEYLIVTITKAKLEPNSILTVNNYHELLRYQGIAIPAQLAGQKDSEYKDVCEKVKELKFLFDLRWTLKINCNFPACNEQHPTATIDKLVILIDDIRTMELGCYNNLFLHLWMCVITV